MQNNFPQALAFVLVDEKGDDDDPNDHGGRTHDGITQREYNAWCDLHGSPHGDVFKMPDATRDAIYHIQYWAPYCDGMPNAADYMFYDVNVNSGMHRAVVTLQRALNVNDDGHLGVVTMAALRDVKDMPRFIQRFSDVHEAFFNAIVAHDPTQHKFIHGWLNRIGHVKVNATKMLSNAP